MKKILVSFVLVVFLWGSIFAGGGSDKKEEKAGGPVKLVYFVSVPPNYKPTDKAVLEKIKQKILSDTGVELEYMVAPIDAGEKNTKLNLLLAGGEQIDIFEANAWEEFQRRGLLADLTELVTANKPLLDVFGTAFGAVKTGDGKIWGIPRNGDAVHYPVWIRKDWLEKVNMAVPTTIDEYEAVLAAFKQADPAGNGKTVPMLTSFDALPNCLLGAFAESGTGVYEAPDGRIMPFFMDPGYYDMLVRVSDWYKKGYIDKETFIYQDAQRIDLIKQGRGGSTAIWYSRVTLNEQELRKLEPDAEYVIAPLSGPKGKAQTVNAYPRLPIGIAATTGTLGYVVNKKCKDVPAALSVLGWGFLDIGNYITSRYGIENEGWRWVDKKAGVFDLLVPQTGDEYCMYKGLVMEMAVRERVSPNERHIQYIFGKEIVDFRNSKYPKDGGIHFDMGPMYDAVPNISDILRLFNEESIKFITGARPLTEYNVFINDLNRLGMDKLAVEITKQYNSFKR
jgi:ABC-type glycerol-3-phosphate transport system substrate-binding protein